MLCAQWHWLERAGPCSSCRRWSSTDQSMLALTLWQLAHNLPLSVAVTCAVVAQLAKVFTHYHVAREWDWRRMLTSGGMPSSHAALVNGLVCAVGSQQGLGSDLFAVVAIFALVVMYDAQGVRLHAGRQAAVLNALVADLPVEHPASTRRAPGELPQSSLQLATNIGHTRSQVAAGAALGWLLGGALVIASGSSGAGGVGGEGGGASPVFRSSTP